MSANKGVGKMIFSDREKLILGAIIDHYLSTGESVGSRTIVKKYNIELSPATIRNVMADLEDGGYIAKTHTSSGRVPTTKGYKYYLDTLLEVKKMSKDEIDKIEEMYERRKSQLEDILENTSEILSKLSSYAGIVLEPDAKSEKIKKIEIVHINKHYLLAVIVMENGSVKTKKMFMDYPVTEEETKVIEKKLNSALKTERASMIQYKMEKMINEDLEEKYGPVEKLAKECLDEMHGEFYMEGTPAILENLERDRPEEVGGVLKFLENKGSLKAVVERMIDEKMIEDNKVNVVLGEDLSIKELGEFSFVFSTYTIGDSRGIIGIMGPKRMEYSKTVSLVKYVGKQVNKAIKELSLLKGGDEDE